MHNTFVLSYDPLMTDPSPVRLLEFIRSNGFTYQYFVPFYGTVFIKSGATLAQLNGSYMPFFSPSSYVLTQIFPVMTSGMLPQAHWDWINAAVPPPLPEAN